MSKWLKRIRVIAELAVVCLGATAIAGALSHEDPYPFPRIMRHHRKD